MENIDPMIRWMVGNLHVGSSDLEVLRYIRKKMKKGTSKGLKKIAYQHALAAHRENQKQYMAVMAGV